MIFLECIGSRACLSAELTGQNRTMNSQVLQIQRFVGLFLSPYVCPTGHHLDPERQRGQRNNLRDFIFKHII